MASMTEAERYFDKIENEILERIVQRMKNVTIIKIDHRITRRSMEKLRSRGYIVEDHRCYLIIRR